MPSLALILVAVILGTIGQFFFKAGTRGIHVEFDHSMLRVFFNPYVMAGIGSYFLSTAVFLKILSQEALSFAYPMISLTYPLVLAGSIVFFHEPVSLSRWLGVALIMLGVFFVGRH